MPAQSPYKLYCKYISAKLHLYTENYNLLKYKNKITVSEEKFNSRRDRFVFNKLANLINYKDTLHFFVAQFAYRDNVSPTNLVDDFQTAKKVFERWQKNINYMWENYEYDLKTIAKTVNYDWKNCFVTKEYDYPILFKMVMGKKIHIETYCILDNLFKFNPKNLEDDMIYQGMNLKYRKYGMLLEMDRNKILEKTPKDLKIFLDKID